MSGTSADGVDAVLVRIKNSGIDTEVETLAFVSLEFKPEFARHILRTAKGDVGGTEDLCYLNFYFGHLFADACEAVCKKAGVKINDIDLVGSHGHTVYHAPFEKEYFGRKICGTLQTGEASVIAQRLGCVVVSDFRVRDMAAGGLGAPLVPYTEYILYASKTKNIALQNIGGIGNITYLPKNCKLSQVTAFDTGPGNMVMDAVCYRITKGEKTYDKGGEIAASGKVSTELLNYLLNDEYLKLPPPKTTGREVYGEEYVNNLMKKAAQLNLDNNDILATATMFTAECIKQGLENFYDEMPHTLIVGGGGAYNKTLMSMIKDCLPNCLVQTNEDIGLDSGAKEAVAFALLANEAVSEICNNAPGATGAKQGVVMGKISL